MEIRVAIFEDNKTLRDCLKQLINTQKGMICTGAFPSANKLVADMELANPDVVLMDINMPGVSGIKAVQIIKKKFPRAQILMQTVFDDNDKIFAAICAGASGYLLKKTPPHKLIEAIRETFLGGAPMTPSIAVKVLQMLKSHTDMKEIEFIDLTMREKEILSLLVKGKSYKSIASDCFISIDTVNTHVRHIYEKLHVHSKGEAIIKAMNQKLF